MALTLLEIVTDVCEEVGVTSPNAVVSATDEQTIQMLALINRALKFLQTRYEWRRCVVQYVFQTSASVTGLTGDVTANSGVITNISSTASLSAGMIAAGEGLAAGFPSILTVDGPTQITLDMTASTTGTGVALTFSAQDYALPSDFDRMVSDTNFDRTDFWSNVGPKSSQEWQYLNSGLISISPRFRWRMYGNKVRFFSAPGAVYNMVFEYVSNFTVLATAGTVPTKSKFTADTDTCIFADDLITLGLKAYWYRAKGLQWEDTWNEFSDTASIRAAQDTSPPRLSLSPTYGEFLLTPESIPDASWTL